MTGLAFGFPVRATAERLLHLRLHESNLDTPICTYFTSPVIIGQSVTIQYFVAVLRMWIANIGFFRLGFHLQLIGSHLLHFGGGMTLHQSVIYDSTINIIGRWRSEYFLVYLQGQVLSFTKRVMDSMKDVI